MENNKNNDCPSLDTKFKMSDLKKDGEELRARINQLLSDIKEKYDNKIKIVYPGDIGFIADELYFERDI